FGTETFTYTISDGNGGTDTATVTVTVNNVNEQPIATDDAATVAEDSTDNIINVLTNDTDPDGDTLTITTVGTGSQGGMIEIAEGATSIRYTPAADVFGTETFTYTISDGNGGSATATVTVTITPVNDDPDAVDDTLPV